MSEAASSADTPFWRFSLKFYRQGGVSEACIDLQDSFGVDVNLLLFLLWLASDDRRLSAAEVKMLDDNVRDWRNLTIIPIRDVRRKLKGAPTLVEAGTQEAFRNKIKAVELDAERLQQEALYAFAKSGPLGTEASPPVAALANIAAYESLLGVNFPKHSVAALASAFAGVIGH
ncbi:MAG TPA: TIGR02444 family protein [Xanthobacteraceae bacterium]|jgi:uncharacterized protein (TIGR02444 family)|nr:TIGR02444 family protein [Xanthobacteraceae bacterium]